MANWNQPMCERCWIEAEGEWDLSTDGNETWEVLVKVRKPARLTDPVVEQCAWCGNPTIFGVYKRADPNEVRYPAPDDLPEPGEPMKGTTNGTSESDRRRDDDADGPDPGPDASGGA